MSLLLLALLGAQPLAVPFIPQQKDACGAAALAMVLRFWQQPASEDEIAAALLEPELKGILGSRLAGFARERGMTAIAYKGDMAQLREYLAKGRPLIVAWKLGRDRYHDVVVVGAREARDRERSRRRRGTEPRRARLREALAGCWLLDAARAPRARILAGPVIALALCALLAGAADYDALVADAVAHSKAGELERADTLLSQAIQLDPSRPEARVERGGLRFLEARYADAVAELEQALRIREDEYTRDLLASSLQLAGRSDDALACWNVIGRPTLDTLTITGLVRTRDLVARRELTLEEGSLLSLDRVRQSRLRLEESGVFERAAIRPIPRGDGHADAEVALFESHGFARGWLDLTTGIGVGALQDRVRLRYANLAGEGIALGAQYRWEKNRPELSLALDWPRPFALGAYLHVEAFTGRQAYDVAVPLVRRAHGTALRLRRVLGSRTVAELTLSAAQRSFSALTPLASAGSERGVQAGVERRLVDRYRQRLDVAARIFGTTFGSDARFTRATLRAGYRLSLSAPENASLERSALAMQIVGGWASHGLSIDERFAPGGSPDMELPLRAHRQAEDGVLGTMPLSRTILLGNLEWRRRLVSAGGVQAGLVTFYDGARVGGAEGGDSNRFNDVGLGLRLALPGATILRLDWGHGLGDGRDAVFFGLRQIF